MLLCEKSIDEHKRDPLCDINLCAVVVLNRWKKPSLRHRLPQTYVILQQPKVSPFLVKAVSFFSFFLAGLNATPVDPDAFPSLHG